MSFAYKVHEQGRDTILAFADSDLLGKEISRGDVRIEISPTFYGEKVTDAGTIIKLAKAATVVNAIGKDAIDLLITHGIVSSEETVEIDGVPHAQIFVIL